MIEHLTKIFYKDGNWIRLYYKTPIYSTDFDNCIFRINGVVFKEYNPAFIKALKGNILWEKLKHS